MSANKSSGDIFDKFSGSQSHWFLTPKNSAPSASVTPLHRINGYDSGLLEASADIGSGVDDTLSLEYRIKNHEKTLAELKNKILIAERSHNQQDLLTYGVKKQRIENELKELNRELAARQISPQNSNVVNFSSAKKASTLNVFKRFVRRNILAKVSKKFNSLVTVSDSIEALKNINQNVDELMRLKSPYGETAQNYQKLTEYLSRANKIHSQISKSIKR